MPIQWWTFSSRKQLWERHSSHLMKFILSELSVIIHNAWSEFFRVATLESITYNPWSCEPLVFVSFEPLVLWTISLVNPGSQTLGQCRMKRAKLSTCDFTLSRRKVKRERNWIRSIGCLIIFRALRHVIEEKRERNWTVFLHEHSQHSEVMNQITAEVTMVESLGFRM